MQPRQPVHPPRRVVNGDVWQKQSAFLFRNFHTKNVSNHNLLPNNKQMLLPSNTFKVAAAALGVHSIGRAVLSSPLFCYPPFRL